MKAKRLSLFADLYNPKLRKDLRQAIIEIDEISKTLFGKPILITNVFEKHGSTDTHLEGRAVDIRTTTEGYYTDKEAEILEKVINTLWSTGAYFTPDKPMVVAYRHDGTADHIHIQCARGTNLKRAY